MTRLRTSPIIICGNQRSGTRMTANIVHLHPDIVITDEFHGKHLDRAFDLIRGLKRTYRNRSYNRAPFDDRGAEIMKSIWIHSSGKNRDKALDARVIGNKSPGIEMRFKKYEAIFSATPPRYIYCLRDAPDVLRSVKNLPSMPWHGNTVRENLDHYLKSVDTYKEMRDQFPERVHLSQVKEMGSTPEDKRAFVEKLFAFLEEDAEQIPAAEIEALQPANTMGQVRKMARGSDSQVVELTTEEEETIYSDPRYREVAAEFGLRTEPESR